MHSCKDTGIQIPSFSLEVAALIGGGKQHLKTIPEIYQAAGIRFDFSKPYIRELMNFVREEMAGI